MRRFAGDESFNRDLIGIANCAEICRIRGGRFFRNFYSCYSHSRTIYLNFNIPSGDFCTKSSPMKPFLNSATSRMNSLMWWGSNCNAREHLSSLLMLSSGFSGCDKYWQASFRNESSFSSSSKSSVGITFLRWEKWLQQAKTCSIQNWLAYSCNPWKPVRTVAALRWSVQLEGSRQKLLFRYDTHENEIL